MEKAYTGRVCPHSLLCMCVFLPDNYNVFFRIVVLAVLVLFRLFVKVFPYITVSIKLRVKKSADQTDIIIDENGIEFLQGNKRIRQTYEAVKEIREDESAFYVGRVYFWKDSMTTAEVSAVRNILKKYGRGKYQYIVKEGTSAWKEDLKTAIIPFALLFLGAFMFVYRDWMIDAGKGYQHRSRRIVMAGISRIRSAAPWSLIRMWKVTAVRKGRAQKQRKHRKIKILSLSLHQTKVPYVCRAQRTETG